MKIANSSLQLAANHQQTQLHEVEESMRTWVGNRPKDSGTGASAASASVDISNAGRAAQAAEGTAIGKDANTGEDHKLQLIKYLLARMTGKDVEVFDAGRMGGAASAPDEGFGVEYDRHESYTEAEQMAFSASGVIQTADGKTLGFTLSMSMERYYHMESDMSIRLGNARQTGDPLVINFSGNAAQLANQRFAFDLNADGNASEQINFLGSGSGFLAFDRNGDGTINDGSELFGARSGNGFAELAALDGDRNGWLDENDAAFAKLSIWIKDRSGTDALRSLKGMGIGAIALDNAASPFSIKDGNNELLGQVRASGIYLKEDGGVGSIQQIDLTV
jgi:hypothetical protein